MDKKITLDDFEQEIEDQLGEFQPIAEQAGFKESLVKAAKLHAKQRQSITIRVSQYDLEAIKLKASKKGLPYQTYLNMLIHHDATRI